MSRLTFFAAVQLAALPLLGSDGLTARDHYLAAGSSDPAWVGVRTSIQVRRDPSDHAAVREVGETSTFKNGDRFRIRVQANAEGFVYLVARESNESLRMLYPDKGSSGRTNRFKAFEPRPIPSKGKTWMVFDNKPAIEGIFLFFSAKPIAELEHLKQDSGVLSSAAFDDLMDRNGKTVSMIYDEPSDTEGAIPATYYVEKRSDTRLFLVRKIDLVHRSDRRSKETQ